LHRERNHGESVTTSFANRLYRTLQRRQDEGGVYEDGHPKYLRHQKEDDCTLENV
jgi:hypothetical protein